MNLNEGFEIETDPSDSGDHEYRGDFTSNAIPAAQPEAETEVVAPTTETPAVVSDATVTDPDNVVVPQEEMFEEVIPGEIPELNENFNAIAALESAFKDLQYVREDIISTGGMTQSIACEADKFIPGFLNEDRPLGFYSKQPSATNLRFALEEINKTQAGVIAAIVAAALAVIYKIYKWFTASPADGGGPLSEKKGDDIVEEANNIKANANDIRDGVDELNKTRVKADDIANDVVKANTNSRTGKLLEGVDGVTFDLLCGNSVMLKKIHMFFDSNNGIRGLGAYLNYMIAAIDSVEVTARKMIASDKLTDSTDATDKYKKIHDGVHPSIADALYKMKFNGQMVPLTDIRDEFQTTFNNLKGETRKFSRLGDAAKNLNDLVNDKLVKEFSAAYDIYSHNLAIMQNKLKELLTIVETSTVTTKGENGEDVTKTYSNDQNRMDLFKALKVFTKAEKELADIINLMYVVLIQKPAYITKLFVGSMEEISRHARKMVDELKKSGSDYDRNKVDDLEEFISTVKKHFKKDGKGWLSF